MNAGGRVGQQVERPCEVERTGLERLDLLEVLAVRAPVRRFPELDAGRVEAADDVGEVTFGARGEQPVAVGLDDEQRVAARVRDVQVRDIERGTRGDDLKRAQICLRVAARHRQKLPETGGDASL